MPSPGSSVVPRGPFSRPKMQIYGGLPPLSITSQDEGSKITGALNLNLDLTEVIIPPDGTVYELVSISAGTLVGIFFFKEIQNQAAGLRPSAIEHYYVL
jgi:hypothetical protein